MTGPEHYREAERLADRAHYFTYGDGADPKTGAALAAEAQVHATLALAAATALGAQGFHGMHTRDAHAWRQVAATTPPTPVDPEAGDQ